MGNSSGNRSMEDKQKKIKLFFKGQAHINIGMKLSNIKVLIYIKAIFTMVMSFIVNGNGSKPKYNFCRKAGL